MLREEGEDEKLEEDIVEKECNYLEEIRESYYEVIEYSNKFEDSYIEYQDRIKNKKDSEESKNTMVELVPSLRTSLKTVKCEYEASKILAEKVATSTDAIEKKTATIYDNC